MLKDKIQKILDKQQGTICPKYSEYRNIPHVEFFKDDKDWSVELTLNIVNGLLKAEYEIDYDEFLTVVIKIS